MKQYEKIKISCSNCNSEREIMFISLQRSLKKNNGKYFCASCKAKAACHKKPQCNKNYWNEEKRKIHGQSVKNSEKYYEAIKTRPDISGQKNPMYGKQHTKETKEKMSKSRTGKLGPNATAWKGGKLSLTKRVKKILHTRFNWYKKIYQRDCFKCVECKSTKKLDAHHIKPVWKIIKELLKNKTFLNEEEKIEWLVNQPELKDDNLENGKTLCRQCHRSAHNKWGSHHVG